MSTRGHHGLLLAGGAVLWTLADLTNPPKQWCNDLSAVTNVSGNASQWNDRSANAWHYTQGTAGFRPLIVSGGLNGRRILRFDGTADTMSSASPSIFQNVATGWLAFVCQRTVSTGGGANRLLYQSFSTAGNTRLRVFADSTLGADKVRMEVRRADGDSLVNLIGTISVNSGPHIILITMDWANRTGRIYVDGTLDVQNTTLTTAGSATSNTSGNNPVLCSSGSSTAYYDGDIAELAIGSGAALPDSTEIDKINGYLAHWWGLEGNLPGGHPYETDPPYL